ncbi:hypothetical protein BCEN4_1480011 [Burkholderia cenocepacia]|nr:hypothetical protein BCEN4_1480011 [Burkholderia cenocepacia]
MAAPRATAAHSIRYRNTEIPFTTFGANPSPYHNVKHSFEPQILARRGSNRSRYSGPDGYKLG